MQRLWLHPFPSKARGTGHSMDTSSVENTLWKYQEMVDNSCDASGFLDVDVFSEVFGDKPFRPCPRVRFVFVFPFFPFSGGARAPFSTRSSNAPCVVQAKFLGSFKCKCFCGASAQQNQRLPVVQIFHIFGSFARVIFFRYVRDPQVYQTWVEFLPQPSNMGW